jgi:hypothetical protein
MLGTTNRIPAAVADDTTEVSEALDVARALWESGERKDAIRWVRRAAEGAAEAGQTTRLAALARAAADLDDASSPPAAPSRPSTAPPLPTNRPSKPTSLPPLSRQPASSVQLVRKAPEPEPTRLRVSVRTSARDATLLVVRPLAESEALPPGTREAFLVMSEAAPEVSAAKGSTG